MARRIVGSRSHPASPAITAGMKGISASLISQLAELHR